MGEIALRALAVSDLPKLLMWRNNPENRKFLREYRPLTLEQHQAWYEDLQQDDHKIQMFSISNKGLLVGACGLTHLDWIARSTEISLYIGEGYIDDKISPVALKLLMAYGFETLGLHRLWAEIWEFDEKKQALLLKSGFKEEVKKRQAHWDGAWYDSLIYGRILEGTL